MCALHPNFIDSHASNMRLQLVLNFFRSRTAAGVAMSLTDFPAYCLTNSSLLESGYNEVVAIAFDETSQELDFKKT